MTIVTFAAGFSPGKDALENGRSAAYPGLHSDGISGTIHGTGSAFHAGILVADPTLSFKQFKDPMWTNLKTASAPDTTTFIQLKGDNIFKITIFHMFFLYRIIQLD
jgi:hypothetical protein